MKLSGIILVLLLAVLLAGCAQSLDLNQEILEAMLRSNVTNASTTFNASSVPRIRLPKSSARTPQQNAELVKQQFLFTYQAYKQYAWGHDEVKPISRTYKDFNTYSLLYTPIDGLDTMYLMGLTDEYNEARDLICYNFTFNKNMNVPVFDMLIRLLGGLLSAYSLSGDECLLDQAIDLGNRILPAWTTGSPSGLPWPSINLATGVVNTGKTSVGVAGVGTSILEMGALSHLTGNSTYFDVSKKVLVEIFNHRSSIGLVGNCLSIVSSPANMWCGASSSIDSGIDSYYEYQLKCWKLFGDEDCKNMWYTSLESISKYLPDPNKQNGELWYKVASMYTGSLVSQVYDLYACFFAGALALSGNLSLAIPNQDANWHMWTQNSIEPSSFNYGLNQPVNTGYDLNPENFESNYYLYVYTKNQTYLDRAEEYLDDLMQYCSCNNTNACVGYSGLTDVRSKTRSDSTASYWFAESLKYLYLTFLNFEDNSPLNFFDVVFNTEAHPFPITWRGPPSV